MRLAEVHTPVMLVRLEPVALQSPAKYSTTEPMRSLHSQMVQLKDKTDHLNVAILYAHHFATSSSNGRHNGVIYVAFSTTIKIKNSPLLKA